MDKFKHLKHVCLYDPENSNDENKKCFLDVLDEEENESKQSNNNVSNDITNEELPSWLIDEDEKDN